MIDHQVDPQRVRQLNAVVFDDEQSGGNGGGVCYWMSRDQRVHDNWALLFAQQKAAEYKVPLIVVFVLVEVKYATERAYNFMLTGLQEVERDCRSLNIPFVVLAGDPVAVLPKFVQQASVGMVVTDFSPLNGGRRWRTQLSPLLPLPFFEVDAHNIVPVWVTSQKAEFAARTIRPKITKLLPQFLTEFPKVQKRSEDGVKEWKKVDWEQVIAGVKVDGTVERVAWIRAGESAAHIALQDFIDHRLPNYNTARNDPTKDGQSNLSPCLHFGQLSAQRVALEVNRAAKENKKLNVSAYAFLEELIIRRELSDNFCFYTPGYDTSKAWPTWAAKTLNLHRHDPRPYIYTQQQLEAAKTHDPAWNAAQTQIVRDGKMHGYMRMYWCKKILEWTRSPEDALAIAISLNDKYSLDGRDPNGYVGIQWSIAGVHDRAWFEREVFGKIRYMNYNGLKRKFEVNAYCKII